MKRSTKIILAVLLASTLGMAQASGGQGQAAAPVQGRPQPQAKSQAEFQSFQEVVAKATPAEQEIGAMEFALKHADSDLRSLLYLSVMRNYQNSNNAEKTVEMARKVIEIDPNNPEALVTLANVLAERTRETDLDREERLAESLKAAQKALQTADTDLMVPPNVPADRLEAVRNVLKSMAHSAMGTVEMSKKNFPAAEQHLDAATKTNTAQPDPVTWLRLAIARDQQKKYPEALEAANQAVKFAPEGSQASTLAKTQRDRLQKLVSGSGGAATAAPAGGAPSTPGAAAPQPNAGGGPTPQ